MRWLKKRDLMFGTKKLPKSVYQVDDCTFVQNSNRKTIINANINEFLCISKTSCDPKCNCFTDKETGMPLKTICTRKLSVLPTSIAPSTRQLYLDGNNFESLGELDSLSNRNGMLTKEIYLNSSRITSVSENVVRRFSHLIILHLDENLIKTLPQYVFGNLVLLKELYLQNNQIMFFADNVFHGLRSLKHLDLSGNKLKVIEPHTLTALSNMQMLRSVQLEKNPWQCSCENQQFYNWLNYNYSMVRNRRDIRCHGKIILEQHPSTFKCEPSVTKKIVVVSMILSIIVLALLLTFLVRYRRECVALLYVKLSLSWCRKKGKSYKPFDAYLIHDDLDDHCHKWLESTFLPRLENGKTAFKIFIPNRDNASATRRPSIGVSPIDTLKQCRCTIMIVSRDTSSNCFCTSALQAAITWSSKDPSHRVILVFYGNVDISTLDDDIKRKVQNRDYLTARGRCFWYRLEYELPKPSPNGQEIHEHEAHVEEDTAIIRNSILFDNTSYI